MINGKSENTATKKADSTVTKEKESGSCSAVETKPSKEKVPVRRSTARPKPNIPGRGADRSKKLEEKTTEENVDSTEDFTLIKPSQTVSEECKERNEVNAERTENKIVEKDIQNKSEVVQEENTPVSCDSKESNTEEGKKENKQLPSRFRSRFPKARPNIEAVARPRIR